MGKVGKPIDLPDYISTHKAMLAMNKKSHHEGFYTDYLCFFRCLSVKLRCKCKTICLCKRVNEHHAKLLFGKFKKQTGYLEAVVSSKVLEQNICWSSKNYSRCQSRCFS